MFDSVILGIAFAGFIVFFFSFSLLIRKFPTNPIYTFFFSFVFGGGTTLLYLWWMFSRTPDSIVHVFSTISISFFLYSLLVNVFIFGVYLNIDSSLHVRILREVAKMGREGLTYKKLLSVYDGRIILEKRLLRLISSGEIEKTGDVFRPHRRFSIILMREKVIGLLAKLYGQ